MEFDILYEISFPIHCCLRAVFSSPPCDKSGMNLQKKDHYDREEGSCVERDGAEEMLHDMTQIENDVKSRMCWYSFCLQCGRWPIHVTLSVLMTS